MVAVASGTVVDDIFEKYAQGFHYLEIIAFGNGKASWKQKFPNTIPVSSAMPVSYFFYAHTRAQGRLGAITSIASVPSRADILYPAA